MVAVYPRLIKYWREKKMTVKECVKYAAESLALDEIAASLKEGGNVAGLSVTDARELEQLVSCAHSVVNEVACEYVQMLQSDSVLSGSEGKIPYGKLSHSVVEVISICSGKYKTPFRPYFGGLDVGKAGEYTVTYAYAPNISDLSDTFDFGNGKVTPRNIGYGIAAEYCIRTGETAAAVLWDKRYKDSLQAAVRRGREQKVRPRRWI